MRKLYSGLLLSGIACALIGKGCQRVNEKKKLGRKDKMVDVTSSDSFPASDPPAWNAGHAVGAPK